MLISKNWWLFFHSYKLLFSELIVLFVVKFLELSLFFLLLTLHFAGRTYVNAPFYESMICMYKVWTVMEVWAKGNIIVVFLLMVFELLLICFSWKICHSEWEVHVHYHQRQRPLHSSWFTSHQKVAIHQKNWQNVSTITNFCTLFRYRFFKLIRRFISGFHNYEGIAKFYIWLSTAKKIYFSINIYIYMVIQSECKFRLWRSNL